MSTFFSARLSLLKEMETQVSSTTTYTQELLIDEYEQDHQSNSINTSTRVQTTSASYLVDYGPIRVRRRRAAAQTLATGRQQVYTPESPEEAAKLEIRRAKNRVAARELRKSRDQIEADLAQQVKDLEEKNARLEAHHKGLEEHKAQLNRAVYNAKQTPLIPFITDMNIPLCFESQHGRDILVDLRPLLKVIDKNFDSFDC